MKKDVILKKDEFFIETIENVLNSENEKIYDFSETQMLEIIKLLDKIENNELRLSIMYKLGVE